MRVRDLGEFGVIERIRAHIQGRLSTSATSALELGIGDDAAVWRASEGTRQVITTDALVQDVHFRLTTTGWKDLGWKSVAVNLSDLAAMGANARYLLVTLGLPGESLLADLIQLYDGMLDLAELARCELIGGDVVAAPLLLLSVTALGEASRDILRRDAGRPGDLVAVTGTLGASAGGLRLMEMDVVGVASGRAGPGEPQPGGSVARQNRTRLLKAHRRPWPRLVEGRALSEAGVRCAMDVSDGLLGDLAHICELSNVDAVIQAETVPIDPALDAEFHEDALSMAVRGGEDYELLCAAPADVIESARTALQLLGTPLTVIGKLTEPSSSGAGVRLVDQAGRSLPAMGSWDHFRE